MTAKKRAAKKTAKKVTAGGVVLHKVYRTYCVTREYVEVKLISAWRHLPQLKKKKATAGGKRNAATRGKEKLEKALGAGSVTGFALFPVPFLTHYFAPGIISEVSVVVFIAIAISCLFPVRKSTEFRSVMTVSLAPLILASAMAVVAMYPATSGEARSEDRAPRDTGTEITPTGELMVIASQVSFFEERSENVDRPNRSAVRTRSTTEMTLEYQPKRWNQLPSLEPGDEIKIIPMGYVWISLDPEPSQGKARFIEPYQQVVTKNTGRVAMHPAVYSADGSTVEVKFIMTR